MPELSTGSPAPGFRLTAVTRQGEAEMQLADFNGKSAVVLYFYPKDDTPGCTREACAFRDQLASYQTAGAVILGISPDGADSHRQFSEKFSLPFPLLADPDHRVAEAYGVWKEKTNYGKTYMGIERTTFVIDREGVIRKVFPRVQVDQHADQVLAFLKTL